MSIIEHIMFISSSNTHMHVTPSILPSCTLVNLIVYKNRLYILYLTWETLYVIMHYKALLISKLLLYNFRNTNLA